MNIHFSIRILAADRHPRKPGPMTVVSSLEDPEGTRCVDIFVRPDGTFGFRECRRDPEDAGRWTLIADYSDLVYTTKHEALRGAAATVGWFSPPGSS